MNVCTCVCVYMYMSVCICTCVYMFDLSNFPHISLILSYSLQSIISTYI